MAEFNLENPFPSESQHESNQPSQPARFYLLILGGFGNLLDLIVLYLYTDYIKQHFYFEDKYSYMNSVGIFIIQKSKIKLKLKHGAPLKYAHSKEDNILNLLT